RVRRDARRKVAKTKERMGDDKVVLMINPIESPPQAVQFVKKRTAPWSGGSRFLCWTREAVEVININHNVARLEKVHKLLGIDFDPSLERRRVERRQNRAAFFHCGSTGSCVWRNTRCASPTSAVHAGQQRSVQKGSVRNT